jgi:hypothetical protein
MTRKLTYRTCLLVGALSRPISWSGYRWQTIGGEQSMHPTSLLRDISCSGVRTPAVIDPTCRSIGTFYVPCASTTGCPYPGSLAVACAMAALGCCHRSIARYTVGPRSGEAEKHTAIHFGLLQGCRSGLQNCTVECTRSIDPHKRGGIILVSTCPIGLPI